MDYRIALLNGNRLNEELKEEYKEEEEEEKEEKEEEEKNDKEYEGKKVECFYINPSGMIHK